MTLAIKLGISQEDCGMALYMVRGGRQGEQEQTILQNDIVAIGWNRLPDLSKIKTRAELKDLYNSKYEGANQNAVTNMVGQIWRFIHDIQIGDLVALPMKSQPSVSIGKVEGAYEYRELAPNVKHTRKVKWLKMIPRSEFDQDLLYSLGAFMTVCRIERNDAEHRVMSMLGERVPSKHDEKNGPEPPIDIEGFAKDEIVKEIGRKYKGHALANLVGGVLKAQGYVIETSPPGPDGGVDIFASRGSLGFESPRICVQVKSTASQCDVKTLRELSGVVSKKKADQGLLVSWSGFTEPLYREAKDDFFVFRLWDSDDLIKALFENYDRLDEELKAELPLKRIWTLVHEQED
jgi:restriction system protein